MVRRGSVVIVVLLGLLASNAEAQRFVVVPLVGYQFEGSFASGSTYNSIQPDTLGAVSLAGSVDFGLLLGVLFGDIFQLELQYDRAQSKLQIDEGADPGDVPAPDVGINYLQLGATLKMPIEIFRPFGTFSVGATRLDPAGGRDKDTYFSLAIGIGALKMLSQRFGLRVQSRLISTNIGKDDRSFCDITDQCFAWTATTNVNQVNLLGGLIIAF